MNIVIIRRSLWLVAALALGYAGFAFWQWRPLELLIAAGIFLILIPVDMLLHREERERRARARTPFGPLQKFGTRTHTAEAPYWKLSDAVEPTTAVSPAKAARMVIHGGQPPARRVRAPWWRRMLRRPTPPWWISAWTPLLLAAVLVGASIGFSARANADPIHDVAFLTVLDDKGITYTSATDAVAAGHTVCNLLDTGYTVQEVGAVVLTSTTLNSYDAGYFIGASVGAFCAEYGDLIRGTPKGQLA